MNLMCREEDMKIVMFPVVESNTPDVEVEIEIDLDFFPCLGDSIWHDNTHYQVVDRYVISNSRKGEMRAATVQYTLEVKIV